MIVKVQRSILEPGLMLVYDEWRTVMGQLPLSKEIDLILEDSLKGYFEATVDDAGTLELLSRVADQDW